jgi:DNA-directed RNA polymerase subunit L
MGTQVAGTIIMAIKVLLNEGNELRIRLIGENHTALQLFRTKLNDNKDVEYSNYFTGHPGLDDPELYLRVKKGKNATKILKTISSDLASEFSKIKFT